MKSLRVTGDEILHSGIDSAMDTILPLVNDSNELAESVYREVVQTLTPVEQTMLIDILTSRGIKVLPIENNVIAQEDVGIETKVDLVRDEILSRTNENGTISETELQEIVDSISDVQVKSRIMEWLAVTDSLKIKRAVDHSQKVEKVRKRVRPITKDYENKVREQIQKVTG